MMKKRRRILNWHHSINSYANTHFFNKKKPTCYSNSVCICISVFVLITCIDSSNL